VPAWDWASTLRIDEIAHRIAANARMATKIEEIS
jgi:hypothetical protein